MHGAAQLLIRQLQFAFQIAKFTLQIRVLMLQVAQIGTIRGGHARVVACEPESERKESERSVVRFGEIFFKLLNLPPKALGLCRADLPYSSSSRYSPRSRDLSRERSRGSRMGMNSRSCGSTNPPRSRD